MRPIVLFDAGRLLSRTERAAPTGIDRVCLAYAEWLIAHPDYDMVPVRGRKGQPALVNVEWFERKVAKLRKRWAGQSGTHLRAVDKKLFSTLAAEVRPEASIRDENAHFEDKRKVVKSRTVRQFFRSRRVEALPKAFAYVNVGHTGLDDPELLATMSEAHIAPIILVHDLIPVTHPEYCRPGDGDKHKRRMRHTLRYGAHLIANSQYTADQLDLFATSQGMVRAPTTVAHLGVEPHLGKGEPLKTKRPYFIYVGTLEARKNLAFLLTVWRRLEERMGDETPSLVLAGRLGWENENALDHLERSPNLQGLVHQVSDLSDLALSSLMQGARAVIAPSSVEGFDLPAVEACAMGLPLLASDIPPHRELTLTARLIDPVDGLGWIEALEDWTRVPPSKPHFSPPCWSDHFKIVEQEILSPLAGKLRGG